MLYYKISCVLICMFFLLTKGDEVIIKKLHETIAALERKPLKIDPSLLEQPKSQQGNATHGQFLGGAFSFMSGGLR
jgi:hypothetical protein